MNSEQIERWRALHELWQAGEKLAEHRRLDEAEERLNQAWLLARVCEDALTLTCVGLSLARVCLELRHASAAEEVLSAADQAVTAGSLVGLEPWVAMGRGAAATQEGRYADARLQFARASESFRSLGQPGPRAFALRALAEHSHWSSTPAELASRRAPAGAILFQRASALARHEGLVGLEAATLVAQSARGLLALQGMASRLSASDARARGALAASTGMEHSERPESLEGVPSLQRIFAWLATAEGAAESIRDRQALGHVELIRAAAFWGQGDVWRTHAAVKLAQQRLSSVADENGMRDAELWLQRIGIWLLVQAWLMVWWKRLTGDETRALGDGNRS